MIELDTKRQKTKQNHDTKTEEEPPERRCGTKDASTDERQGEEEVLESVHLIARFRPLTVSQTPALRIPQMTRTTGQTAAPPPESLSKCVKYPYQYGTPTNHTRMTSPMMRLTSGPPRSLQPPCRQRCRKRHHPSRWAMCRAELRIRRPIEVR